MVKKKEDKKSKLEKLKLDLAFDYHSSRFFSLLFSAIYIIAVTAFCIEYKIIPGPEFLVLGILFYASYNKRTWSALKDWLPFVTVFISYEIMYSIVGTISSSNLHLAPMNFDIRLFGTIPTLILQQSFRFPILRLMQGLFYTASTFLCQRFLLLFSGGKVQRTTGNTLLPLAC